VIDPLGNYVIVDTLSMQPPMHCVCRPLVTSEFATVEARSRRKLMIPPPPLKRWSARLVHRARAPGQRFRVRTSVWICRFSGLFIGTYSAVPYAALCRVASRTRSVHCVFAVESSVGVAVHRAAQGVLYAVALISRGRVRALRSRPLGRDDDWQAERQGGGARRAAPGQTRFAESLNRRCRRGGCCVNGQAEVALIAYAI
jgi:hypothetical protein